MKKFLFCCFLFSVSHLSAQDFNFTALGIDPALEKNANAVVREETIDIHIVAIDKMRIVTRRIVTILNDKGDKFAQPYEGYSKEIKIEDQRAILYGPLGTEIKRYKKKDFEDRSLIGSNDLYNDRRVSFLNYTPREYPYTIVYESEVVGANTIFVRDWDPVSGYFLGVEKAVYNFHNPTNIPFRFKEINTEGVEIERKHNGNNLSFTLRNFPAYDYEYLSPALEKFSPQVRIALNQFSLVGRRGVGGDWKELGKWEYENLIAGRNGLPEATKAKITQLTAGAKTDIEKARIIYQYVQDNTRYISVQLGIGGWEPIPATEVDKLKYGDCKGLTNYTKALLDSQNIPSYYAVVLAGEEIRDIDPEFASMQGNHVILNLPQEDEDVWLECTSQTHPFNYLGDFTDNRHVLLLKPEGGEIVKTKAYSVAENLQVSETVIRLDPAGAFSAEVERRSSGIPYGDIYGITSIPEKDQVLYYKKSLGHLRKLDISEVSFHNDRDNQEFSEKLVMAGEGLASKAGKRLLLPVNFIVPDIYRVPRREVRDRPLEIARGKTYKDNFKYVLPEGFVPEALPEDVEIENEFGSYKFKIVAKEEEGEKILEVERSYMLKEGIWPAESYQKFRDFMNEVDTFSNRKAVIVAAD